MRSDQKTENTLKNYQSTINRLKTLTGGDFLSGLKNPKKLIKTIQSEYGNNNTRKTYFSRIIQLIKENPQWKVPASTLSQYRNIFEKLDKLAQDKVDTNKMTDKEKKNWIDFKEMSKIREKLSHEAKDFTSYQDYLIISLYTLNPPVRLDYTPMKVVKTCKIGQNENVNVLCMTKKPKFIMNKFKTAKFYGPNEIEISPSLKKIIDDWFRLYNPAKKWLLLDEDEKSPMSQQNLGKKIRAIIKHHTGKSAGLNMLRHSFISTMINGMTNLKNRKNIAKQMGHSVNQQLQYMKLV